MGNVAIVADTRQKKLFMIITIISIILSLWVANLMLESNLKCCFQDRLDLHLTLHFVS
jgi:hypothetical protein